MYTIKEQIDCESLSYGEPKKGTDKKLFISIGTEPIFIQFSKLKLVNNLQGQEFMDLLITPEIVEYIEELEEQLKEQTKKQKEEWFGNEEITDGYLDNAFMSCVKKVKKQSLIKVRMTESCQFYNITREEVNVEEFTKDSTISVIIQLSGIWFSKTRFGITLKVNQSKLHGVPKPIKGVYLFEDVEDDGLDLHDFPADVE